MINVFGYGSNGVEQVMQRVQMDEKRRAEFTWHPAMLKDYVRVFGGWSHNWEGAVASLTSHPRGRVYGLLMKLNAQEIERLNKFEGRHYELTPVQVYNECTRQEEHAYAYIKTRDMAFKGPPSHAYLEAIATMLKSRGGAQTGTHTLKKPIAIRVWDPEKKNKLKIWGYYKEAIKQA